jgi:hypothetical protein
VGGGARQVPCVPKTVILDINPEQVDWCLVDAREAFEEEKERSASSLQRCRCINERNWQNRHG